MYIFEGANEDKLFMKHLYMFFFAMALTFSAVAQSNYRPGYIRKADGSVQQGLLDYRSETRLAQKLRFKPTESSREMVFEPGQLQGYGFDRGKRYETHTISTADSAQQSYFLEVLVKGTADLYFTNQNGLERYFIQKGELPLQELVLEQKRIETGGKMYRQELKLYIGTLTYLFNDCKKVLPQLERTHFEQSELTKVTANYNKCVGPGDENFAKDSTSRVKIKIALVAGVNVTKANFTSVSDKFAYLVSGNHAASVAPTFGISFDINHRRNETLSLNTGLHFSSYKLDGQYEKFTSKQVWDKYIYSLRASYLKVPLMLRYTHPRGMFKPFAGIGVQQGLLVSNESKVEKDVLFYSISRVSESESMDSPRVYEAGIVGSIGAITGVSEKTSISIEARIEKNNGLSSYNSLKQNNCVSSLLVGLLF